MNDREAMKGILKVMADGEERTVREVEDAVLGTTPYDPYIIDFDRIVVATCAYRLSLRGELARRTDERGLPCYRWAA